MPSSVNMKAQTITHYLQGISAIDEVEGACSALLCSACRWEDTIQRLTATCQSIQFLSLIPGCPSQALGSAFQSSLRSQLWI